MEFTPRRRSAWRLLHTVVVGVEPPVDRDPPAASGRLRHCTQQGGRVIAG